MLYLKLIELENWVKAQSLSLLWKDPYVITEVKSPILFKIIDKKNKESVVHLDRIKLCKDLDHHHSQRVKVQYGKNTWHTLHFI